MEVTMKNILLLVHDDEGQEARLQTALDLTRALEGHLTCVDVIQLPVLIGDFYSGIGEAMLMADEHAREGRNKTVLQERLNKEGIPWNWIDAVGNMADCVLEAATLADVIVVNRKLDGFPVPYMHNIASRILMHAHKPIVAVPDSLERFETGRALIAWDGDASAAATKRACVPLLALASEVHIFMVRDGKEKTMPEEAAEYLSRHDIHPSISIVSDRIRTPDTIIAEECVRFRADYILMGAYNRGRLAETFGGVTRRMLSGSKLPLILGH
jgi:nucleotide-binding universal stress UspA family protein